MAKSRKQGKSTAQDEGQLYMQRLERNLAYFKRHRPTLYNMLARMDLERVELVVTPGRADVDMVVNGQSCYRGHAKGYSRDEARQMLRDNAGRTKIRTFPPAGVASYSQKNFASSLLRKIIAKSPLANSRFEGYCRGDFFPSLVFLGCGLGYHIEEVLNRAEVINAIVVEREPEKFAVSLYTVDWDKILKSFRKAGKTLTFAVGKAGSDAEIKALVHRHMVKDLPFYPFFSTYYNHLADVEMAKGVLAASEDLAVLATNWSNYDNELIRIVNTVHNARSGMTYLANLGRKPIPFPMAVVGSGPSLDGRMDSLKKMRDQLFLVSAGTGLKPLLAAGVTPDLHVELDPSYIIYQLHKELPQEVLKTIPLLAVNEVNPLVCGLFKSVTYFFKSDNMLPKLAVSESEAFSGCNPTVTNAAVAIGEALGFKKIYLFGTDYGFKDESVHHARHSAWGEEYAEPIRRREERMKTENKPSRRIFEVEGVDGTSVLTRNDYYTAKRSLEDFLSNAILGASSELRVYNCADGAVIDHATWMSSTDFEGSLSGAKVQVLDVEELFASHKKELPRGAYDIPVVKVHHELKRVCSKYQAILKKAKCFGRKDLCLLVNQLRVEAVTVCPDIGTQVVRPEQLYCAQLLKGSMLHFLAAGLCHGMACGDHEIKEFMQFWKGCFLAFLEKVSSHYEAVMLSGRTLDDDPWVRRSRADDDPDFDEA
ncbi:6-hydroxymethylpterin diphosphokinase MptE-like protein [Marinobacter sp.]|uniref:motility associated factor glycosyltransferase family protein n=1 Tax=Marinobacter sp. TaxID=50741 RepID=UPI003564B00F